MEKLMRIAIDGPAAAGKSTVAKRVAQKLSIIYIDTGAMYRALTLKVLNKNIEIDNEKAIEKILQATTITLKNVNDKQTVILDNKDVTEAIRSHDVSNNVSHIAQFATVRNIMVERQKQLSDKASVVMDGRDIGTIVLPDAEVKIFLIASVEERAVRRYKENKSKGLDSDLEILKSEIEARDYRDMNRDVSPLIKAKDAIELDTSSLSIQEVVDKIISIIEEYQEKR